tara:strand:- start:321 stop:602 length:282 start_codon:yes stop_codon:yes gene_type:complete
MEKKTNMAKENNNREDNHFSESWYRDGARLGFSTKLPHSIVDKKQKDGRDEVSRLLRKQKVIFWLKFWHIGIAVSVALSYLAAKWVDSVLPSP